MPFPSVLNTFNRPATTDRLNSPSHSALHNTVSSAVGQIEQVIGLSTTSVAGSLFYNIRSPDSDGGGHIQTANKGGTGQTTFIKGDLLIATSSSVVAKLAIGANGQIFKVNSSTASGVNWVDDSTPRIFSSVLASTIGRSTAIETSIFSTTVNGSVLGTSNVVRTRINIQRFDNNSANSVMLMATYGGGRVASMLVRNTQFNSNTRKGIIEYDLFGNGATNAQAADIRLSIGSFNPSMLGTQDVESGVASVESTANQVIGMTAKWADADTNNFLLVNGITVEKIT